MTEHTAGCRPCCRLQTRHRWWHSRLGTCTAIAHSLRPLLLLVFCRGIRPQCSTTLLAAVPPVVTRTTPKFWIRRLSPTPVPNARAPVRNTSLPLHWHWLGLCWQGFKDHTSTYTESVNRKPHKLTGLSRLHRGHSLACTAAPSLSPWKQGKYLLYASFSLSLVSPLPTAYLVPHASGGWLLGRHAALDKGMLSRVLVVIVLLLPPFP